MSQTNTPAVPAFFRLRRWWLLPLALWAAFNLFEFQNQMNELRRHTTQVAIEGARNMFRMVVLTREWNASHGGLYVPVTPRTQPNPYLKHPKRDLLTTDGMALTMVNPAYMTRLIAEMAESDSGSVFRLTSLKPTRPGNAPDAWEERALNLFEQGNKEIWGLESTEKGDFLRYMAPLLVKENCLVCHAAQGYKAGDIRGGISVSQNYAPIASAMALRSNQITLSTLGYFIVVAVLGWLSLEMLRRRWLELTGKIGELETAQFQLLQSEKMAAIGQLAAGVAHEINNPVGFVNSNLGTLKFYTHELLDLACAYESGDPERIAAARSKTDLTFMQEDLPALLIESQEGLGRVKKIVQDLKDFSHVDEAGRQPANLNAGMESTLNVVWNELKYKAEIVRELGDIPEVDCVPAQINQVFMNMLINAAHAIEQQGRITIRSGCTDDQVWFEIEDTGKGMSEAVMQHIFEPFYTTKPVGKGTGLGLSISYDIIVKKHGGTIDVRSTPGAGTCFRVGLPRQTPAD